MLSRVVGSFFFKRTGSYFIWELAGAAGAGLCLCCCTWAFSSCIERGCSSLPCADFYRGGFSCCGAQALRRVDFSSCGTRGLVASWHVESSQTRDGTGVPCIGRQILKHWTTREVLGCNVFISRGLIAPCSTLGPLLEGESESHSVVSNSLRPHGLYSPWSSPGQNTGVSVLSLLQGIFPTQG